MARVTGIRLVESFFRRWMWCLLPLALLVAVGVRSTAQTVDRYRSVGTVRVAGTTVTSSLTGIASDPGFGWDTPAAATSKQVNSLLQTDSFIHDVIARADLGSSSAPETLVPVVRSAVTTWATGANLVDVSATFDEPRAAQRLARAVIDAFVQNTLDDGLANSQAAESFFKDLSAKYAADVQQARSARDAYLVGHPTSGPDVVRPDDERLELARLNDELGKAQTRYDSVLGKSEDARLASEQARQDVTQRLEVVDPANLPAGPLPRLKTSVMTIGMFSLLGLVLAVLIVVLGAVIDDSIRQPSDVERHLGSRLLAVVPDAGREARTPRPTRASSGRRSPVVPPPAAARRMTRTEPRVTARTPAKAPATGAGRAVGEAEPATSAWAKRGGARSVETKGWEVGAAQLEVHAEAMSRQPIQAPLGGDVDPQVAAGAPEADRVAVTATADVPSSDASSAAPVRKGTGQTRASKSAAANGTKSKTATKERKTNGTATARKARATTVASGTPDDAPVVGHATETGEAVALSEPVDQAGG